MELEDDFNDEDCFGLTPLGRKVQKMRDFRAWELDKEKERKNQRKKKKFTRLLTETDNDNA